MKLAPITCLVLGTITSACGAPGPSDSGGDAAVSTDAAATDGASAKDAGLGIDAALDPCTGIDEIAAKIYLCFVIHNEEDDANGVPGSMPSIPDYNGDQATFDHFADAMQDYAVMLSSYGATLSFQPDWTFTEGVASYRPEFFAELLALGNVEVVPHAHETIVPYDQLYDRLDQLGASPEPILGGMLFEQFTSKQEWFSAHPEFVFWGAPTATVNHVDDKPAPPFVYRIPPPEAVAEVEDLYVHVASSPIIVTAGVPANPAVMFAVKPEGRLLSPSYAFRATREFLAAPDDTSVPPKWRKHDSSGQTSAELISSVRQTIENDYLPLVTQGRLEFKTVGEVIALYRQYEACLDLADGQDLSGYVPAPP